MQKKKTYIALTQTKIYFLSMQWSMNAYHDRLETISSFWYWNIKITYVIEDWRYF